MSWKMTSGSGFVFLDYTERRFRFGQAECGQLVTAIPAAEARPQRADARRNRERILESARTVFEQCGAEAQIDDVAKHAGVGVGTVYRHFPTKEALVSELVRQKFRLFADRAREALDSGEEPFASLVGL